ncbi:tail tube [Serratia phage 92A1]|nr:tail tube [Serratia phage 92A1]
MYTLDDFNSQAVNIDFHRTNMFSVVFATTPTAKSQQLLDQFGGMLYNNMPAAFDFMGISQNELTQGVTQLATIGTQQLVRKSGVSKYLLGAMSNRVVQSLLGEFEVGTYLLDFFNMAFPQSGLMIHSVKLPENRLSYEMDRMHNAPNIRITSRDFDPVILTFRMDSEASNYRAMNDWVNSVEDPVTGLRALPEDVECDLQVNLHNRNGIPHTVCMLNGAIPVGVGAPTLSYEGNNEITTFDVTFAYRYMAVGAVGEQAAIDWVESKGIHVIDKINPDRSLPGQLGQYSRLNGAFGGIGRIVGGGRIL